MFLNFSEKRKKGEEDGKFYSDSGKINLLLYKSFKPGHSFQLSMEFLCD